MTAATACKQNMDQFLCGTLNDFHIRPRGVQTSRQTKQDIVNASEQEVGCPETNCFWMDARHPR